MAFQGAMIKQIPGTAPVFADFGAQSDDAYLDLLTKKLSWGDYLRKRKDITSVFTKALGAQVIQVGLN
jgi:hypothetical protein